MLVSYLAKRCVHRCVIGSRHEQFHVDNPSNHSKKAQAHGEPPLVVFECSKGEPESGSSYYHTENDVRLT
jgi:hypothetical protein